MESSNATVDIRSIREVPEIMSDALCERLFRNVISAKSALSSATLKRVQTALRASIHLPGFRDANNAPEKLLFQHAVCAFRQHSTELIAALLQAWLELQTNFSEAVRVHLGHINVVATIPSNYPRYFIGPLNVEELQNLASSFCELNKDTDYDSTLLMTFCLTRWRPLAVADDRKSVTQTLAADESTTGDDYLSTAERDLELLDQRVQALVVQLGKAASNLTNAGKLPDPELITAIQNVRQETTTLSDRIWISDQETTLIWLSPNQRRRFPSCALR